MLAASQGGPGVEAAKVLFLNQRLLTIMITHKQIHVNFLPLKECKNISHNSAWRPPQFQQQQKIAF